MDISEDRYYQLTEKVYKLNKDTYNRAPWKDMDNSLRIVMEHLAGLTIINLYDKYTDQIKKQKDKNKEVLFTTHLLERAQRCCKEKISQEAANIWNPLIRDVSEHNISLHGTYEANRLKEKKAYENTKRTIAILNKFLLIDSQHITGFPKDLKEKFSEVGWHITQIKNFIDKTACAPEEEEKVKSTIKEIIGTTSLPYCNEYYYALILPKDLSQESIEALTPLAVFKWNFVFDFGSNTGNVFSNWNRITDTKLINVTNSTKRLSKDVDNWIFMRGAKGDDGKSSIKKLIRSLSTHPLSHKNILVFNLATTAEDVYEALYCLWDLLSISEDREIWTDTTIYTVKNDGTNSIADLLKDDGYQVESVKEVEVSHELFIDTIRWALPSTAVVNEDMIPMLNRQKYLDAGIKFIDTDDGYEAKAVWDNFYAGHQIKSEELDFQYDVQPRGNEKKYKNFTDKLRESIKDLSRSVFRIRHQPGAGGTTVGRRIAFDLHRESEGKFFPIWIVKWDSTTPEQMKDLEHKLAYVERWLIITEEKEIEDNDFQTLLRKLKSYNIPAVYIRISHHLSLDKFSSEEATLLLLSKLSGDKECKKFDCKFENAFKYTIPPDDIKTILRGLKDDNATPEMIHYPYSFTERAMKNEPVNLDHPDTYVRRWFESIEGDGVKTLLGLIAFTYRFALSRSLDVYSVESLWRSKERKGGFMDNIGDQNKIVLTHLLKLSNENGSSVDTSTYYAPRYAAFAKQMLDSWKSTWGSRLSEISIQLIKLLPLNGDVEEALLRELFITQSKNFRGRRDIKESKDLQLTDRVSYLIGSILESVEGLDGAINVFDTLIEKYPDKQIYAVHKARLLFEYAHTNRFGPEDRLFVEAENLMSGVLQDEVNDDTIYHVAGMFWDRKVKAIYREKEKSLVMEVERKELELTIVEIVDKALERFDLCSEMNQGRSQYGYVSSARLIIWLLQRVAILRKKTVSDLIEEEKFIKYLDKLEQHISVLESNFFDEAGVVDDQLMKLRMQYFNLIGDLQKTLTLIREKFDKADNRYKNYYGHQEVSIMLYKEGINKRTSLKTRYLSLDRDEIKRMETVLLILRDSSKDLRAAEKLFRLYRFVNRDSLENSPTSSALKTWYTLAKTSDDKISLMNAAYYMSIMCALRLMEASIEDKTLKDKYQVYKKEAERIGFEKDESTGISHLYLGVDFNGRWDCLLERDEAFVDGRDGNRLFSNRCKRVEATITKIDRRRGFCQIGLLHDISFGAQKLGSSDLGKKKLDKGVVGFSYAGPGLYNFEIALVGNYPKLENVEEEMDESEFIEVATAPLNSTRSNIQDASVGNKMKEDGVEQKIVANYFKVELPPLGVKVIGKIDLDRITDRRKRMK